MRIIAAMLGVAQRLNELGIVLPEPPQPIASYVPARMVGHLLYVSGQIPMRDGTIVCQGSVPSDVSIVEANAAARQCGLNALAVAADALGGDLDRVISVVQVRISVASDAGFGDQPAVANGASDLFQEIFGEAGRHTRVAVGAIALPVGVSVEVDVVFEVEQTAG
ncbi:MAG: RidA family protein [Phycisphaerales bacterium]|nr:RidA family protein [Phycisphaerales bacterium]